METEPDFRPYREQKLAPTSILILYAALALRCVKATKS
jgi:hypothetical protein